MTTQEKIKPQPYILFCAACLIGGVFVAGFLWLFGIEVSSYEKISSFPDGWSVLELVWNATALILFFAAVRAAYKGLNAYYYGEPNDEPPTI